MTYDEMEAAAQKRFHDTWIDKEHWNERNQYWSIGSYREDGASYAIFIRDHDASEAPLIWGVELKRPIP